MATNALIGAIVGGVLYCALAWILSRGSVSITAIVLVIHALSTFWNIKDLRSLNQIDVFNMTALHGTKFGFVLGFGGIVSIIWESFAGDVGD